MEITTRPVTKEDRLLFEQLHSAYLAEVEPDNPHAPDGWLENVFSQALSRERWLLLASYGAEIIGFVDFKILPFFPGSNDKFAIVHDFYIVQSQRRRGFGRALASSLVVEAQRQGAANIELNVSPHNPRAMQFWQSIGFKLRHYSLEMSTGED